MSSYESLNKEITKQEKIEGVTPNTILVRKIVKHLKNSSDISTFFNIKFHRYGELSYQVHRFYYVKQNIANLFEEIKKDQ